MMLVFAMLAMVVLPACAGTHEARPAQPSVGADDREGWDPYAEDDPAAIRRSYSAVLSAEVDSVAESDKAAWRKFLELASSFDVRDGISRKEAYFLGWLYFWRMTACGAGPEPPQDAGPEWRMTPRVSIDGHPSPYPIRVDKRSGTVSWASKPPIEANDLLQLERERLLRKLGRDVVTEPVSN